MRSKQEEGMDMVFFPLTDKVCDSLHCVDCERTRMDDEKKESIRHDDDRQNDKMFRVHK